MNKKRILRIAFLPILIPAGLAGWLLLSIGSPEKHQKPLKKNL
jgi:hypothetical protein